MRNFLIIALVLLSSTPSFAQLSKESNRETFSSKIGSDKDDVIVGGADKFEPKVTFTRWGGEESITIKAPTGLLDDASTSMSDGKLTAKKGDVGMYFTQHDPQTFKFGLMFDSEPSTNSFSFQIDGWENFDFHYQRPLDNENEDGSTWEPNDPEQYAIDGTGGVSHRPADVNGSYAVYHKTKRDGEVYKTGKFCHIYRPKFIDSNGDWVWADLDITNGVYTITIPNKFLKDAVYPIRANDTIGITTVGATDDSGNLNVYHAARNTSPSTATYLQMKIATWYSGGGINMKVAMYGDGGGGNWGGGALISSGGAKAVTQTTKPVVDGDWTFFSISAPLVSGTTYFLGFCTDSNNTNIAKDDTQGNRSSNSTGTTYAAFPPDPFPTPGTGGTAGQTWSIYATTDPIVVTTYSVNLYNTTMNNVNIYG